MIRSLSSFLPGAASGAAGFADKVMALPSKSDTQMATSDGKERLVVGWVVSSRGSLVVAVVGWFGGGAGGHC